MQNLLCQHPRSRIRRNALALPAFFVASVATQVQPPAGLDVVASPSAAPAFASAPASSPVGGGSVLLKDVGSRLEKEHRTLGQVSAKLLALGAEVDQAEEQLLGRVLTTQDAKNLVYRHTTLDARNEMSRDSLARLDQKVDELSSELAQAQHTRIVAAEAQREKERRLNEQVAQQQAQLQSLRDETAVISNLELYRTKLLKARETLADNGTRAVRKYDDITRQLNEVNASIQSEIAEEARLRKVLQEVHGYGVMCHTRAKDVQSTIVKVSNQVVTRTAADVATEGHGKAVAKANTQRVLAETGLLRAEVRRVDDAGKSALVALTDRRAELAALERDIIDEVKNLTERLDLAKQRAAKLQHQAKQSEGSELEHIAETRALEEKLRSLQRRVSPVVYAALEAENNALGAELDQATTLLTRSKVSEASTFAAMQQASAEVEGQQNAAKLAAEQVEAAREEAEKKLKAALEQSEANKATHEKHLAEAMAVIEARCKPKWDARQTETSNEITACRKIEEEYTVVAAQEETLRQTLKAKETASAAVE